MKYEYITATGKNTIEIDEKWNSILIKLDRQTRNANQRETRRHASLEAYDQDDCLFPSDMDISSEYECKERIAIAMEHLLPEQLKLIRQVFIEGISKSEIARREGVDKSAISHRLNLAYKRIKKHME
jgi:DNA-directed RNA polymerase specialized sigma24 family protein